MVGGPIAGKLHYRVNWKWRTILNLSAYNVKDPSTLTNEQRFTRLYRASLRRHHLLSIVRMRLLHAHHKNFFEHAEKTRLKFEKAKNLKGPEMELFMKEVEEWLEMTFFPAASHWPTRLYSNKYHLNVPYPDPFHEADPAGYYSPKPIFGAVPSSGPYFQEYPKVNNLFFIEPYSPSLQDPYLKEHLTKIEDPELKKKLKYKNMSVSNPSVVYTVDELFLADCTPSNFDMQDSDSMYSASFMDRSRKSNSNCGILAFYMLKFLVGRLLYNKMRYLKNLKFRALIKWKYWTPHENEFDVSELIIKKAFKVAFRYFKSVLKTRWMKWVKFTRLAAVCAKFNRRKNRRDEVHHGQVKQVKRVIAQISLKKSETERDLESSLVNERKLKEIYEKNGKAVKTSSDSKKNKMAFKKVIQENEDLKDTLEAINFNVGNLIKEIGGVIGLEDIHMDQESGLEESQLKTSRRKKLSGLRC